MKFGVWAASAAFVIAVLVSPASAGTINVSAHDAGNQDRPSLWTYDISFNLPTGFTGAQLVFTTYDTDDRSVLQLNGSTVASTGIPIGGAPGGRNGFMTFTIGGSNDPFLFEYGNGGPYAPITSGFIEGANLLRFIVNDTSFGVNGDLFTNTLNGTSFITHLNFDGVVSFDVAATPLPATLPLFAAGLAGLGWAVRRRKQKQLAA